MRNQIIKSITETSKRRRFYLQIIIFSAIFIALLLFVFGIYYIQMGFSVNNAMSLGINNPYLIIGGLSEIFAIVIVLFSLSKGKKLSEIHSSDELKLKYSTELIEDLNPQAKEFANLMLLNKVLESNIEPEDYLNLLESDKTAPDSLLKELLDSEEKTTLRIYFTKGVHLNDLQKLLVGFSLAYQGFYFLYYPSKIPFRLNDDDDRERYYDYIKYRRRYFDYPPFFLFHYPIYGNWISKDDSLYISKISISSPGFWEFLGKIMPLRQLREYLNERHERQKDRQYKNKLEEEKIRSDNERQRRMVEMEMEEREYELFRKKNIGTIQDELEKNKVIKERIEILKNMGFSDEEIKEMITIPLSEGMSIMDFFKLNGTLDSKTARLKGEKPDDSPPQLTEGKKEDK